MDEIKRDLSLELTIYYLIIWLFIYLFIYLFIFVKRFIWSMYLDLVHTKNVLFLVSKILVFKAILKFKFLK